MDGFQEQNCSEYVQGSIVRVQLKNFITYDSIEFRPGPHLNVIIGPNGTGKSAIVCAICLGLAGKTAVLGRASDPRDYIKRGAEKAMIEIELYNARSAVNYTVKREISNKKSQWWLNGKSVTQKEVEETVKRLSIQIGNLCQFLPQEKVAEFARMSQQELLENTEKSVGQVGMYEKHQELKTARVKARELEMEIAKLQKALNEERQKNAHLEQDVKSYNERQTFTKKLAVLKMKKPWLEYRGLKDCHERGKKEMNMKAVELKKEQSLFQPLQKKHDGLKAQKERLEREIKAMTQQMQSKAVSLGELSQNVNGITEKIDDARSEYDLKVKEEDARKKRLSDLQEQLKALESALVNMDDSDTQRIADSVEKTALDLRNLSMKMSSIHSKGEGLRREIDALKTEIREYEVETRQIRDVNNRKLEKLRSLHQDTYKAVVWLRSNQDKFQQEIHEPMIICLNVKDSQDAKQVENHVSFNDLRAFVCENTGDMEKFLNVMKNDLKLRVNAVMAPKSQANSYSPQFPISHYQKYGFERFLQKLFTCPEPVMRYLCDMYRVHSIPVGSRDVVNHAQQILQHCTELRTFYTPDIQYSIKRSKYNASSVSSRNTVLRDPRALSDSVNVEREKELIKLIENQSQAQKSKEEEYKQLQKISEELESKMNELREEKKKLQKLKDQRKTVENQIVTKKQRIQQVMKDAVNIEVEERKLQDRLKEIVKEKMNNIDKMKHVTENCLRIANERIQKSLDLFGCTQAFSQIEEEKRNVEQRFEGLEKEVTDLKENVKDLLNQAKDKLKEAKRASNLQATDDLRIELTKRGEWEEFDKAPSHLDELEGEIHRLQVRADESMFRVDKQVVLNFEQRKKEILRMEKEQKIVETQIQTHQETVSKLQEEWINPLKDLITCINDNFSYFFTNLQCSGEVSLSIPADPEDYEKYGVCIKVKFRDSETLRELTAHHQSGGERSVSTVLYMMALQELTRCPFRCVDEINQGMDPKNERKIFQLVVQTVCKRNTSQYFLLTPKLLPDLQYGENMTVLCVYNGPQMVGHKKWKLQDFLQRRRAIQEY